MSERELFGAALYLQEAARVAFLDQACANDPVLREKVQSMLLEHEQLGSFLEHPPVMPSQDTVDHDSQVDPNATADQPAEKIGTIIAGKYKLLEAIGEGGMGAVWLAQQSDPVKRKVAVKLIKAGMDSKGVLARFEAERQALAMMDHPNIAKILDGGLHDGRPFFVMELVKGVPITEYCDARKLTPKQRLELFVPVCNAIQHAHQKGIIHRDIKPNNVMIALYDDRPVPKVIDFGVAKATGGALTDLTLNTAFGGVVGTPQYMSPEQATLNNLDIDTRSDIYSLGILLYELLAGSPPFQKKELERAGLLEILRVVREEEPPKPSTKLSTADALPSLSANRGTEPKKLAGILRNELDWIVMKALEKDRARRYETANGFAADVLRYLSGEAVQAHPPSASYRVRKFLRKNRGPVVAAGLICLALLAGMGGTTWGLIVARQETARVRAEEQKVREEQGRTQAARDAAELNLVRSYLRPIGYNTTGIDQAELVALDELTLRSDDRIKFLFLREALNDGETALRFARRVERVVQAAVGTSLKRRAAVLEHVIPMQSDPKADPRSRLAATWIAIELGLKDIAPLDPCLEILLNQKDFSDWDNLIGQLPDRIRPKQRVALFNSLSALVGRTADSSALYAAANAMAALAPHVDGASAKAGFDAWIGVLDKTADPGALNAAQVALVALIPKVDAEAAKAGFKAWIDVLGKTTNLNVLNAAHVALVALIPKVDAEAAKAGFNAWARILSKTRDINVVNAAGNGMASFVSRIDTATAKEGFMTLVNVVSNTIDRNFIRGSTEVIHVLVRQLDAAAVKVCFDALVAIPVNSTNDLAIYTVESSLTALAFQIAFHSDAVTVKSTFSTVVGILTKSSCEDEWYGACCCLHALLTGVWAADAVVARVGFDKLVKILEKGTKSNFYHTALAVRQLGPYLDAKTAKLRFDEFVKVLLTSTNHAAMNAAVVGLEAVAPQADAVGAAAGFAALIGVLDKAKEKHDVLSSVEDGMTNLAPLLEPMAARTAFNELVGVLGKASDAKILALAWKVLPSLVSRVDEKTLKLGCDAWLRILSKPANAGALKEAVTGLTALAPSVDPVTAKQFFDAFVGVLVKAADSDVLKETGIGLMALATRVDAVTAKQGFDALFGVMGKTTNADVLKAAENGLMALALRFDAGTVKREFDALVVVVGNTTNVGTLKAAITVLTTLANRVDAGTAKRGFDALVIAMSKTSEEQALYSVLNALTALAQQFDAAMAKAGFDALIEVKGKITDVNISNAVERNLISLASHLDSAAAKVGFDALLGVLRKPNSGYLSDDMPYLFETLISRLEKSTQSTHSVLVIDQFIGMNQLNSNYIPNEDVIGKLIQKIDKLEVLSDFLRDPACLGPLKDAVLLRLEELAYPNPAPAAAFAGLAADPRSALLIPALKLASDADRKLNRRFRAVSDAALWLSEHHPEIDLDKPYNKK